jgi:hypothetical protein
MHPLKVFTFYSNRFESATTSIALEEAGIPHRVLIHNQEQADGFAKTGIVRGELVITGKPRGLAYQRNAALDLVDRGGWCAFLCDDYLRSASLPKELILSSVQKLDVTMENQALFRFSKKDNTVSLKEVFDLAPMLIEIAEKNGIHLIGFALDDNPHRLTSKFGTTGLADGRFWLIKKSFYRFDENAQLADDVAWTAENLVRHGRVLILNWLIPYFRRYTAGGFGSMQERLELRRKECEYLARKYDPLVQIAHKTGWPEGTHLRIIGSGNNIQKARERILRMKKT